MRKTTLTLAILLLSVVAFSQNLKKLDEKNGFRDLAFETDSATIKDLEFLEGEKHNRYYTRPSDELKVGNAELTEIIYGFYKGKLSTVSLKTKGITNSRALLEALTAQYGRGYQSNRYMQEYLWSGKKVIMSYDENSATHDATVYMFSRPLVNQQKVDEKEAAGKASKDL